MIIFGGVLVPSERFTTELWTYYFLDGTWDVTTWQPSINYTYSNFTSPQNASSNNMTIDYDYQDVDNLDGYDVSQEDMYNISNNSISDGMLPLPVRGHTAHVIGDKMLVFFGIIRASNSQLSLIQELDLGKLLSKNQTNYKYLSITQFTFVILL